MANLLTGLGIDEYLTRTDVVSGMASNFLADALGSPIMVADNAGVVQTEYTYESFGRATASGALNISSYQYTGRENDGTGLYYYRARYYDPQIQRFISEDPILSPTALDIPFLVPHLLDEPSKLHSYAYVVNNPLKFRDPLGLDPECEKEAGRRLRRCIDWVAFAEGIPLTISLAGCLLANVAFAPCAVAVVIAYEALSTPAVMACLYIYYTDLKKCKECKK